MQTIILASKSPRRRELLAHLGVDFVCLDPAVDETLENGLAPHAAAGLLAANKARAISRLHPQAVCIGADTVVACRGRILGKPANKAEAVSMLNCLQGARHDVYTGVCVRHEAKGVDLRDFCHSTVRFLPMTQEDICAYVDTGEPFDKAGGYAIQGGAAAFIHGIVGSHDNVIGLPLSLVRAMLRRAGAI
jgi:septum formation protein